MSEASKQPFDPEATVSQPGAELDPEATLGGPGSPRKLAEPDAESTTPGRRAAEPDPEITASGPAFDPEATINRGDLDPDSTVRIPSPGRRRNPFAPQALPDMLLANLSSLGGINPLAAMANPILGVVPQIRHALTHPDPKRLRETLHGQIESFETSAMSADIPDAIASSAVLALCALLDESAASTPWGRDWSTNGVLALMRNGAAPNAFTAELERLLADPAADPDLLELYYLCLALGFEGRRELDATRAKLHEVVSRRRPRPDGLSAQWRATATRSAAPAHAPVHIVAPVPPPRPVAQPAPTPPKQHARPALPKATKLRIGLAVAAAVVVSFVLVLRLLEPELPSEARPRAQKDAKAAQVSQAPEVAAALARAFEGAPVTVSAEGGRVLIALRSANQFPSGATRPRAELLPLLQKIGQAIEEVPGSITVIGHADALPVRAGAPSNQEISSARAAAAAKALAAGMSGSRPVGAQGKADAEPLTAGKTAAERARNRRVVVVLTPSS